MIVALVAMALAFDPADKPAIAACHARRLTPDGMGECVDWKRAPSVVLGGFNGTPAQQTKARVLWNDEWLFFNFDCADSAVISPGAEDGLDHFRLGDTAEVFIARRGDKSYAEIHATPAGLKTTYFCSDYRRPTNPPQAAEKIRIVASKLSRGWRVFVAVPRSLFGPARKIDAYDIFFGRYDYSAVGGKPELSSYPAQLGDKPDFHRRESYAILRLKP